MMKVMRDEFDDCVILATGKVGNGWTGVCLEPGNANVAVGECRVASSGFAFYGDFVEVDGDYTIKAPEKVYDYGSIFENQEGGELYILSYVGGSVLISLTDGHYYNDVKQKLKGRVTQTELLAISGLASFEFVAASFKDL